MRRAPLFASALVLLAFAPVFACTESDDVEPPATTTTTTSTTTTGAGGGGGAGGGSSGVEIPGLSAGVHAVYDQNGILHLSCAADDDCFATLGYFHASNRFFFMDFVRNLVRGKLGKLVKAGDTVLSQDYENRQWFATTQGEPLEEKLYADASPEVRGHLDAYTRGVNAWIDDMRKGENGATLTTEYDFLYIVKENIRDWEAPDSAAVGLYVMNDLSNNSAAELAQAAAAPSFAPALAADLFSPKPVFDAFTVTAANGPAPTSAVDDGKWAAFGPMLRDASARMDRIGGGSALRAAGETGSNNWVLSPSRTTNGHALLSNDPHLGLTNPSIWFPVELDAVSDGTGSYHVAGSTFPGVPAVLLGHNEHIAWGATVTYYDLADEYLETLSADGKSVIFNASEVPIVEKTFTFDDASTNTPVQKTFRWVPHHGPIVSEDAANGTAISIRWRGHDGGTDLDAFFGLGLAKSADEARLALEKVSVASQNFVVVDTDGDIGWYPYAKVPSRPWATPALGPWLPLPGDGTAEWGAPVPIADLPQLTNPPNGAIATANADMTGASADGDITNDGQAAMQAWSKADGTREQRILDLLDQGGNAHTVDTMHALQGDTYSLYGSFVVPLVLAAENGQTLTADEQAVVDALTAWQLTCPTGLVGSDPVMATDSADPDETAESIGCSAFHATFFSIVDAALADEYAAATVDLDSSAMLLVARALKDPASIASGDLLWDDVSTSPAVETRDDVLRKAVSTAAQFLAISGAPNTWRWGRLHTLTLRSIYDSFGFATYNEGPYAAPGGLFTVNVANPRVRTLPEAGKPWDFAFGSGPSIRFVVEAGPDRPHMSYELPGGSDLHRESPFYNNLMENWLVNKPIEFLFGKGAVTNPAVEVDVNPPK